MLSYEAFARQAADLLALEWEFPIHPSVELYSDLGLDSLKAFQLLVAIETLAGIDVPPLEIPELYTMSDSYGYYRLLVQETSPDLS